jgi:hypothetical protein
VVFVCLHSVGNLLILVVDGGLPCVLKLELLEKGCELKTTEDDCNIFVVDSYILFDELLDLGNDPPNFGVFALKLDCQRRVVIFYIERSWLVVFIVVISKSEVAWSRFDE